jgi:hypothetical protein
MWLGIYYLDILHGGLGTWYLRLAFLTFTPALTASSNDSFV